MLKSSDPELYAAIQAELRRQQNCLEMIPSENFTSRAVLEAAGSILTNKYAEGYPGKRYYGGCEHVDTAENLARDRAKSLFGAEHANVQPHCGSSANMGVYFAMLDPGDRIMGMDLSHGGHLTHGFKVSFSGRLFSSHPYGVDKQTEMIDFSSLRRQAREVKPKMIICGASAYPRILDFKAFREIADEVGAYLMADIAHIAGLVVANAHPSPINHAHFVTSTTHKTLRGPRSGVILTKSEFAEKIDKAIMPHLQGGPLMHIIAAKAVCFKEAATPQFHAYSHQVVKNCKVLADTLMAGGLRLVSGGTDTHLVLVDLTKKSITGKEAECALDQAGITCNKNTIPFDTKSPMVTSGIRLGTPAITTRGMKEDEMGQIGEWIIKVISDPKNDSLKSKIRSDVKALCDRFLLYQDL
ncbi:serine hydroxymethyltransferase [Candidatus Woesearchaeota archaeon]|nr:serine hydroxymethyltransferase [Candidatus Woesearchaeota archaeon]